MLTISEVEDHSRLMVAKRHSSRSLEPLEVQKNNVDEDEDMEPVDLENEEAAEEDVQHQNEDVEMPLCDNKHEDVQVVAAEEDEMDEKVEEEEDVEVKNGSSVVEEVQMRDAEEEEPQVIKADSVLAASSKKGAKQPQTEFPSLQEFLDGCDATGRCGGRPASKAA
ncbi:unnamed protein product, partial [Amoebophrya sp. A25]|eukprot:GSA25T00014682001.1